MSQPDTPDYAVANGAMLSAMIAATFEQAYVLAVQGMSIEAMLIDYDIQAAASQQHTSINACARTVIKAAARAVQRRIPFCIAFACIMEHVDTYILGALHARAQADA